MTNCEYKYDDIRKKRDRTISKVRCSVDSEECYYAGPLHLCPVYLVFQAAIEEPLLQLDINLGKSRNNHNKPDIVINVNL